MAKLDWHGDKLLQRIRATTTIRLTTAGVQGKAEVQSRTPRRTGNLQDSEHYVVLDENGGHLAGDETDGNGNPVPAHGGNGKMRVVVGTNEGAETGKWYALAVETGTRGQPGKAMLASALPITVSVLEHEIERGLI